MNEREYTCMGGPLNGRRVSLTVRSHRIVFPIAPAVTVKAHDDIEWEEDPWTGLPRVKREPFGQALYEVSGDLLLFVA